MQQTGFEIEPFFLTGEQGALFCIHLYPTDITPKGNILYLHPFAEEMHKSRRMAALQARRFAAEGYAVLQVDLTGCGDSACDFGDATWAAWLSDARRAHAWLTTKTTGPVILWGLRTGASLAVELASTLPGIQHLVLWQPVINGEQFLTQFLRIKLASEMLSGSQTQSGTKALRTKLETGESIEVGGYMLGAAMAHDLARLKLGTPPPPCPVTWLEVGAEESDHPTPASQRIVDAWRTAGVTVHTRTVTGEPFWVTQEITECPGFIEATSRLAFNL
ncbi:MAG: hydrolase 2, exosortase A system-associated [Gallionellaceae bacterium]|nr:hydrolase 2, exosortase A system-associated [Gallionellaceae bacterium]